MVILHLWLVFVGSSPNALDLKIAREIRAHKEKAEIPSVPSSIRRNQKGQIPGRQFSFLDAKFFDPPLISAPDRVPEGTWFVSRTAKDSPWVFLGPSPATGEYWSDGTVSGRVAWILPHPGDPQTVYIASAGGGVWKTTDGGTTWSPLTDHLPVLTGGALAFDPTDPNILYYGTGEFHNCWDCGYGDGLFRSPDGGLTWEKIAASARVGRYIARIVIPPQRPSWIYVANRTGLAVSQDSGATWVWRRSEPTTDVLVHPLHSDTVLAATRTNGVYRSTDGGATWALITALPTTGYYRAQLAYAPSNPDVMYASFGTSIDYTLLGLYISTDGGVTWDLVDGAPDYLGGQGFYNHTLAVDPADPFTVYAGGVFPYDASTFGFVKIVVTDAGGGDYIAGSYVDLTDRGANGRLHPDIHHIVFGPDTTLWVATDGGVWKSPDRGNSWVNLNSTLALTQFYTLSVHPTSPDLIVGGTQDNGTMIRFNHPEWRVYASGDGGPTTWTFQGGLERFFKTYVNMWYLTRYRLTSGYPNPSWVQESVPEPWQSAGDDADWANGVLENVGDSLLFVGTERVWMSADAGDSWTSISGTLSAGAVVLSLAAASGESLYVGLSDGSIFFTPDQGLTWEDRSPALNRTYERINELAVSPLNGADVYACVGFWSPNSSGPRVLHTTDGGFTWTDVSGDLPINLDCLSMAVDFASGVVYVGTEQGVFYSTDGTTYTRLGTLSAQVYDMELRGGELVVATHGRGIWKAPAVTVVAERPRRKSEAVVWLGSRLHLLGMSGTVDVVAYDPQGRKEWVQSLRVDGDASLRLPLGRGLHILHVRSPRRSWRLPVVILP